MQQHPLENLTVIAGTPVGIAVSPHDTGYWVAFDTGQVVGFPGGETESLTSQTFTGTGDTAVGPFELEGGLAINTYSHDGESNFIVELLDESGETVDLLVTADGDWDVSAG